MSLVLSAASDSDTLASARSKFRGEPILTSDSPVKADQAVLKQALPPTAQ